MVDQLISRFRFVCRRCGHQNDCHHIHPHHLRPHLVSTTCVSCQAFNWLGGLTGAIVETEPARASLRTAVLPGLGRARTKASQPPRH